MKRKLKFQGGITKTITIKIAKKNKEVFAKQVDQNFDFMFSNFSKNAPSINLDLVSFSSSRDYYDQLLSIFSFVRYVGIPNQWTIYSDGSHTKFQKQLISKHLTFATIETTAWNQGIPELNLIAELKSYEEYLFDYASKLPLGKKALYYINHNLTCPTLFLDSDIVFYERADTLLKLTKEEKGWYIPDPDWGCLDPNYKSNNEEQYYQINSGFILMNTTQLNLNPGLEFLKNLEGKYSYFSEQTMMHLILKQNHFMPLDRREFVIDTADQFDFSYLKSPKEMAVRHYTGPVRHKMWQRDYKWHLSL